MSGTVLLGCVLAVASALVAGCSRLEGGSAVPDTGLGVASPGPPPMLPPVPVYRDIRGYGDRPCEVFTFDQLTGFGFDRPPESIATLPSGNKICVWIDSGHNGRLAVGTYPDWNVLDRTYAARASLPVFEPIELVGLPAVVYQAGVGLPRCDVTVEVAERQGLDVTFTDLREPYTDSCRTARAAAQTAVANLPPLN
jgi:hypothetical protein